MSLVATNTFNCLIPDDPVSQAAGEILPSHWNTPLPVTGTLPGTSVDGGATGQILRAQTGNPAAWSTATYPDAATIGEVVHAINTNVYGTRASFTYDGQYLQVAADAVASDMVIRVIHTGSTSTGRSVLLSQTQSGGGDAVSQWESFGAQAWTAGVDVSASNAWKLSAGTTLGTNDAVSVTTAGVVSFPTAAQASLNAITQVAAATNEYVLTKDTGTGNALWKVAAGGAALSGITAATAGNTIASGNNHSQIWNWALTTDSVNAFAFGETTAATNGTSTSGVPNQVIARFSTLSASTASPLSVYSRAAHVFSVSPSTAQIFSANGTNSAPIYSFAGQTNKGFYYDSGFGAPAISAGSQMSAAFGTASTFVRPGSANSPGLTDVTTSSSGIFWTSTPAVGVTFGEESKRWTVGTTLNSYAAANATGYALNFRKARGSVASPTVITTGDDLATISGFGYVGATGTYVEACQIKFDSTGTIANTTSGVGGIMRFGASVVGTVGITEVMRLQVATTTGGGWLSMDEADANPGTGDLAADDAFSIYRKADKLVIAHNLAGVMNYLTIPLDGATTTWTQGTGAP